jgi:hypothetical protein
MNLYKTHFKHKRFNSTDITPPSTTTHFPFIKPKKLILTSRQHATPNITHSFSSTDNLNTRSSLILSRSNTEQHVDKIITEINTSHFLKKSLFKPKTKLQLNAVTNSHINFILGINGTNSDTTYTNNILSTHNNSLLSKQLSLIFNDKTHKILTNDKKNKYTYNNFRKKIMNDFSDNKDDNHKRIIIESKRNYKKFVKVLDNKINENINHAKQVEMLFYQKKYKDMNYKCKSMWDIKQTNSRHTNTKRNTSKDISKYSTNTNVHEFIRKNIKLPHTRIERNMLLKDKLNRNESITYNSNTNVNNNYYKLKELLSTTNNNSNSNSSNTRNIMNKYSKYYQSNTEPNFLKKHFSKETIKRFRQYNGVFFGLPV